MAAFAYLAGNRRRFGGFGLSTTNPSTPDPDQSALYCTNCGGQCHYAPTRHALECLSCGEKFDLSQPDDNRAAEEFPHDPDAPQADPPVLNTSDTHQCRNCGGEVIFTGPALSEACPYCNGPMVLHSGDAGYATMALIPFRIDKKHAQKQAAAWVASRTAAPTNLSAHVGRADLAGLYAPFWTFDSQEAVQYWAKYTTGSGDNRRTHSTTGRMNITFDDMLMPASPHVTPLIRDGILHEFDPYDLKPYRAGYLSGFAAERHHQSVAQGLVANMPDKNLLIRNKIKRKINKRGVHAIRYNTDTTGIHYRRILLPVWMLHYQYSGKAYKVVVSGIDGRTFGERPFSTLKMLAYSSALTAAALVFGLMWGAAGLL